MRQSKLSDEELSERDEKVVDGMEKIKESFQEIARKFDDIELLNERQAPHGLMEKARTISWLVEQIYVQNLVERENELGLENVGYPDDDLIIYDLKVELPDDSTIYYINVKTGLLSSSSNKNDLSKAAKVAQFYHKHSDEDFAVVAMNMKVDFRGDERLIDLDDGEIHVDNVSWINSEDVYVNPSNRNLQCSLNKPVEIRSKDEFVHHLLYGSKGILNAVNERGAQIPLGKDDLGFDHREYESKSDLG